MRITLVGYRASGKNTVGQLLAHRLKWRFIDADRLMEERSGRPIASWFASGGEGESKFRDAEEACLKSILAGKPRNLVLATGGGAILRPANRKLLKENGGLVIYLEAEAKTIQARLRADIGGRPSLTGADVVDEVPALLKARGPFYTEVAQKTIPAELAPEEIAKRIAEMLG